MPSNTRNLLLFAAVSYFVAAGIVLTPYPGIDVDEALFGHAIYAPEQTVYDVPVASHQVPVMLLDYLGAFKAWLFAPIFEFWRPSVYSVRLPVVGLGVLTVLLFYALLNATAGSVAAIAGAFLLATDPVFLITTTLDWGPVAVQNLLLVTGALLLVRFHRRANSWYLAGGFFALGLAFWNKAIFLWALSGLAVAAVFLLRSELRGLFTWRRCRIALSAFCLGCLPLLIYNIGSGLQTFRGKSYSFAEFGSKTQILSDSIDGTVLLGYLTRPPWDEETREPETRTERASLWLHGTGVYGRVPHGLLWIGLPAAAVFGLWRRQTRRPLLFFAVAFGVGWIQMATTENAGGGVHHIVTLWIFLYAFLAVGLASLLTFVKWGRLALFASIGLLACANVMVANTHLAHLIRYGPAVRWTDAMQPLTDAISETNPRRVFAVDWGFGETITLLSQGQIEVEFAIRPYQRQDWDDAEFDRVRELISLPDVVFVNHTEGNRSFPALARLLEEAAAETGYEPESTVVVPDNHGRPIFQVFKFRPRHDRSDQVP